MLKHFIYFFIPLISYLHASLVFSQHQLSITTDFPGGNIVVERIVNDTLYLRPDLRDTQGEWFYWYFAINNAAGKKLFFHFTQPNSLAAFGPSVSTNRGKSWQWLYTTPVSSNSFTYSFPATASEVRFSMGMPYMEADLQAFLSTYSNNPDIRLETLCTTPKGRAVEKIIIGKAAEKPTYKVLLTARHHACEMMASYVMEGLMQALLSADKDMIWLRQQVEVMLIPFMDKDGVEEGDQGKNRLPRDHNRDYSGQSLYTSTAALRTQIPLWAQDKLRVAMDLHCPYINGQEHEKIFIVGVADNRLDAEQKKFAAILEKKAKGALSFKAAVNYLPYGTSWNKASLTAKGMLFSQWAATMEGMAMSIPIEFPYATNMGQMITADNARMFGKDIAHALAIYVKGLN